MTHPWLDIWKVVQTFWRAILAVSVLIGILNLPRDISEQWSTWGPLISVLTRETALIVFVAICAVWIVWMDVRPYVRERLARKRPMIFVAVASFELGDNPPTAILDRGESNNVEHIHMWEAYAGEVMVQFQKPVDPETLSAFGWHADGFGQHSDEEKIEIVEKTNRRALITLPYAQEGIKFKVTFQCAEC